jgi:hypothetical protein
MTTTLGATLGTASGSAVRVGRERLRQVGSWVSARRSAGGPPLLLGAGLAALLSIGGVAAVSAIPPDSASGSGRVSGTEDTAEPEPEPESEAAGAGSDSGQTRAAGHSVLTGDDPAAAVLELLRRRTACLGQASVLCLDGVDQPGSVAMAADGYLIRQLQGTEPAVDVGAAAVVPQEAEVREHTGNSALVVLGYGSETGINAQPASALVIKGEAGWRLRELFDS